MTPQRFIIAFGSAILLCVSPARAQTSGAGGKPSGAEPGAARPPAARPGGEGAEPRKPPARPEAEPRKPRPRPGDKPREGKPGTASPAGKPEARPGARPSPGAAGPEARPGPVAAPRPEPRPEPRPARPRPRPDEDADEEKSDKVETNAPLRTFRRPEPIPKHSENTRAFLIKVGFGINGCTDDLCKRTEPMLYLRTQGLFQLGRYFAAGLHMAYLFSYYRDRPGLSKIEG